MFVETPVWVTGTIVRYRPVDPHVMIELAEPQPGGRARKWIVEGPRMGRLERILENNGGIAANAILKVGDRITFCGFPLKKDYDPNRMYADWPPEQDRFVHAQVMVMPGDGRLQSWGPYGVIDNCVRLQHHTPKQFVDEVNRGMVAPCR